MSITWKRVKILAANMFPSFSAREIKKIQSSDSSKFKKGTKYSILFVLDVILTQLICPIIAIIPTIIIMIPFHFTDSINMVTFSAIYIISYVMVLWLWNREWSKRE